MPKLSFIVPVYNVESYLRKCVDSLLTQDYEDYEIILVEDGSTDNSAALCDEIASSSLASFYHSIIPIRVIHQQNAGLSAARNAGLKAAEGVYVCFVDSDDYWQPNVLAGLIAQIERDNLDVLRFKYQNVNEEREVFNPYKSDPAKDNDYSEMPTDGVSFLNSRMNTQCYAVMFIIKRKLLEDCTFTEGIYFEDTDWTPRMLARAKRVASTDTIVYNYLVREGSISRAIDRTKQQKVLDDKMRLVETMQMQSNDLQTQGKDNRWFARMISDTVISIISILSTQLYEERGGYLDKLNQYCVYPIETTSIKARLINLSPRIAVELLHIKNAKTLQN